MVSGSDDKTLRVWDLRNGKYLAIKNEPNGAITDIKFHPTEMIFAAGSQVKNTYKNAKFSKTGLGIMHKFLLVWLNYGLRLS